VSCARIDTCGLPVDDCQLLHTPPSPLSRGEWSCTGAGARPRLSPYSPPAEGCSAGGGEQGVVVGIDNYCHWLHTPPSPEGSVLSCGGWGRTISKSEISIPTSQFAELPGRLFSPHPTPLFRKAAPEGSGLVLAPGPGRGFHPTPLLRRGAPPEAERGGSNAAGRSMLQYGQARPPSGTSPPGH